MPPEALEGGGSDLAAAGAERHVKTGRPVTFHTVRVPMRDAATLATDVYLSSDDRGPRPTILVRTTYGRTNVGNSVDVSRFVAAGYAVVAQDVRGRYDSDGAFYHGVAEVADGYDTIEWVASQPWSDGKVGMTGVSYLAAVQCAAACSGTRHLHSLFHVKAPFDYYQNGNRHYGAFHMYMLPVTLYFAATSKEALADPLLQQRLTTAFEQARAWLARLPLKPGLNPLRDVPSVERWLLDMMRHELYDEFWTSVCLWQPGEFLADYADVAGYYVGGWYDMYREDEFFVQLAARQRRPVRLMMGPWTHHDFTSCSGDVDFGDDAALSYDEYMGFQLRWFADTLGSGEGDQSDQLPVRIFVMGGGSGCKTSAGRLSHGGQWRSEREWPLNRAMVTPFYFRVDGALSPNLPTETRSISSYRYDPDRPTPTVGGTSWFVNRENEVHEPGSGRWTMFVPHAAQDQRDGDGLPLSARQDVLVFQTDALADDVEVTGRISAQLWVSSTAVDTDFIVRVIDVYPPSHDYPDGYALNITDGLLRARYRESFRQPVPLEPGAVTECCVELAATSNLFRAGHRIRVDVASSSYPAVDPNPNNGTPFGSAMGAVVAINTVHHEVGAASCVNLPIVAQAAKW